MKRYSIWFILLAAWLLVACSKESEQTVTPTPTPTPTPGGQTPDKPDPTPQPPVVGDGDPMWLVATTRAGVDSDNEDYSPIQIFLISGPEGALTSKREGLFMYDAGWYSTIGLKESDPWACIYGYSPADAAQCAISPLSGTSYHSGAELTMSKVNAASGDDLCVIIGVKHAETAIDAQGIPARGQFAFERKSNNYVGLLLDHIFARIDFKVKIGLEYNKRRHVKVKKLELLSDYELTGVTVKLTAGDTQASTNPKVEYALSAVAAEADKPTGIVYDFTEDASHPMGLPLTTEGSDNIFSGYFAPDADSKIAQGLSLVCTYDVYVIDNNNKIGTRVRENCVAVNSLKGVFSSLNAPLKRGQKTTLILTVEPTYLYQLSDDELDNPGIKIEN